MASGFWLTDLAQCFCPHPLYPEKSRFMSTRKVVTSTICPSLLLPPQRFVEHFQPPRGFALVYRNPKLVRVHRESGHQGWHCSRLSGPNPERNNMSPTPGVRIGADRFWCRVVTEPDASVGSQSSGPDPSTLPALKQSCSSPLRRRQGRLAHRGNTQHRPHRIFVTCAGRRRPARRQQHQPHGWLCGKDLSSQVVVFPFMAESHHIGLNATTFWTRIC